MTNHSNLTTTSDNSVLQSHQGEQKARKERKKVAIVGAAGQLGHALLADPGAAEADIVALTRAELDLSDSEAIASTSALADVDVIINAAAYTDVDGAESDPGAAHVVNAVGAKLLAQRAAKEDAFFIQVSTDYVFGNVHFDGEPRPLLPDAPTVPQTMYGRTKLVGENSVIESGADYAIVRTAWVWSGPTQSEAKDFVSTMLSLAERKIPITVVDDQHGNPTFVGDLARALWELVNAPQRGVFHVVGTGEATWFDFACEIFRCAGYDPSLITPVDSSQYLRPAQRPHWSVLDTSGWAEAGFQPLPVWQDTLAAVLA